MRKSKNLPRTASIAFCPLFQNSYPEHVVKSPGVEKKLKLFREFKEQRPLVEHSKRFRKKMSVEAQNKAKKKAENMLAQIALLE